MPFLYITASRARFGQVLDQPARVVERPVRVVRREQQDLLALHPLQRAGQLGLVLGVVQRLGGELDVVLDVLRRLALDVHPRLARFVDRVHPPHQRQDPAECVLDEDDPQRRETVEDAVEDQAHHLVGGQQRVGDHEVVVVAGESHRRGRQLVELAARQVAAHRHVVLGGGGPDRVVFRVAPWRPRLGLDQNLRHVGVPGPLLDLARRLLRAPRWRRRSIRATARASCCGCRASDWPASRSRRPPSRAAPRACAPGRRRVPGSPMSEPASMISWRNAMSGSLPGNSPSGGKVSVRIA